ncbi:DMT family transporter [Dyella kyungheensis]|jgi:drug/metabolite transporter (DMT)-like permease|uniref:DMT family transporter n=1 Tax=Dyella kyungheensis TaxID=1242174 RepID=A0ABS2JUX0_9GAMM|nr:DMT family transporter [Dyella kyungheensis]MBM7122247.1 DMT family transporter [Dyella kyungheensis]
MKTSDVTALILLGALWGASFLFMRMGANEFGGMALAGMRAIGAAICSIPLLTRTRLTEMRTHWRDIAIVGIANSALPFVLFSFAAQSLPAGVSAISDAIAPLLVALSGWMLLGEKLNPMQASGLVIGFTGVVWLVAGTVGFGGGTHAMGWAMAACLGANVCYTFGAHYSHRRLRSGVTPLSVATGSQLAAAVLLLPFTVWMWPTRTPGWSAWLAVLGLAALCTSLAYVLFYGLMARVGASRSMVVMFLIPVFGVVWGLVFLHEPVTLAMAGGCIVILLGVALTTGLVRLRRNRGPVPNEVAVEHP